MHHNPNVRNPHKPHWRAMAATKTRITCCPISTGIDENSLCPSTYDFEIWLASALLAVTLPLLIISAVFFDFWPFKQQDS